MAVKFIFRISYDAYDKYGQDLYNRFGKDMDVHKYPDKSTGVGYSITVGTMDDMRFIREYLCKFDRYFWVRLKRVEGNIMRGAWTYYLTYSGGIRRHQGSIADGTDLWWYPYDKIQHLFKRERDPMYGLYLQAAPRDKDPNIKDQLVPVRYTIKFYLIDDRFTGDNSANEFLDRVTKFLDEHNLYYTTRWTFNRHICVRIFNISEMCKDKIMGAIEYAKAQGWTNDGGVEIKVSLDPVIANHKIGEVSGMGTEARDIELTRKYSAEFKVEERKNIMPDFSKIIVNGPATIGWVGCIDSKKTIIKLHKGDNYDAEKAVLMLYVKSMFSTEAAFHSWMRRQMRMMRDAKDDFERKNLIGKHETEVTTDIKKRGRKPGVQPHTKDMGGQKVRWTDEEVNFLYENKDKGPAWIAEQLGRSKQSVGGKMHQLRLTKKKKG